MSLFAPNRFRIASPLGFAEARAAIRAGLDSLPAKSDYVWGFVAGRFVWLVLIFRSPTPTAWAWISETREGVVASGFRQVSLVLYLFFAACLGITIGRFVLLGEREALWMALALTGSIALCAWADRRWHAEGDPLVAYLNRALGVAVDERLCAPRSLDLTRPDLVRAAKAAPLAGARLTFDGEAGRFPPTQSGILDAVAALETENFVILEFAEQEYMQAAATPGGFCLEHRDGGADRHFRAEGTIDREDVAIALLHYLATRKALPGLRWDRVRL